MTSDFDYEVSAEQLSLRGVRYGMVHRIERIVLFSLYVPFWGPVKGIIFSRQKTEEEKTSKYEQ